MRSGSFQVAPLQFERVIARPPPQEDKENPFIVTSMDPSSPGSTKKRKIPLGDQQDLELKDSPKRINITPAVEPAVDARDSELEGGEEGTESDEGLGQVQRKIEYLSLKRARDSSPPSPPSIESPDDDHLTVPDPNIDDASPRKRSRLSFLGQAPATSNADKPALPEMPHIDLSRPPPSPTRLRQPTSPTKFTGMPQLQKGALPRSPRGASLFSVALGNRLEKEKEKEVDLKPRPTFIGRVEPSLPTLPPVTFPITMNTPSTTIPQPHYLMAMRSLHLRHGNPRRRLLPSLFQ
ncbi:hypothetical protein CALCODRAFT_486960 [Calocera cornea HHB12733]|uniref:Uncharacterized protein n=1 Tax=Calocera cornea HHB12733 TaxID=1353952 RepID=A0A165DEZ7_9BASI|nr:hypothetical protein CALCODRAFT_486960 [Calocera cornea HHB12733]